MRDNNHRQTAAAGRRPKRRAGRSINLEIVLGVLYLEKHLLTIMNGLGVGAILSIALGLLTLAAWTCRKPWARGASRFAAKGLLVGIILITIIPGNIANGAKELGDDALTQINTLIEGFAVMVAASCVVPILVLLFSLWVANILLGIDISAPAGILRSRAAKMKPRGGANRSSDARMTMGR